MTGRFSSRRTSYALVAASLLFPLLAGSAKQVPANDGAAQQVAAEQAAVDRKAGRKFALEARIRELDDRIRKLRQAKAGRHQASERPTEAENVDQISTQFAGDAGRVWKPGPADLKAQEELDAAIDDVDGLRLSKLLESYLGRGIEGYQGLRDLFDYLDTNVGKGLMLIGDYKLRFGMTHILMRHEDEVAEFAHYLLTSSKAERDRSTFHKAVYSYAPTLLAYHKDRYPDLRREFVQDIESELQNENFNPIILSAATTIGFYPDARTIETLLGRATTLQYWSAICKHLESWDDPVAIGILVRFVQAKEKKREIGFEVDTALIHLSRMTNPLSGPALEQFLTSKNAYVYGAAIRAFFMRKQDGDSGDIVIEYLNRDAVYKDKRRLIFELNTYNPELVDQLGQRIDEVSGEKIKDLIRRQLAWKKINEERAR